MGSSFSSEKGLGDSEIFSKAALVASDPLNFESIEMLNEEDKVLLRREVTHKWDQPKTLVSTSIFYSFSPIDLFFYFFLFLDIVLSSSNVFSSSSRTRSR